MKKYLFRNRFMLIAFLLVVPISCFLSIKFALSFDPIIQSVINKSLEGLKASAIWCSIYALSDCIFLLIQKYVVENLLKESYIELKKDLFSKIINMDTESFNKENIGSYISILDNDVQLLSSNYFNNILSTYKVGVSFIFSFVTVFFLSYQITIMLIIVTILSIIIPKLLKNRLADIQEKYSLNMRNYTSQVKGFFEGFQVIKSFNIQGNVIKSHKKYNKDREDSGCIARKTIYLAGWISMLFSSAMYVCTYIVGGYLVILGRLSVGLVVSLSQLIGGVVAPLEKLPAILAEVHSTYKVRERLTDILNSNSKIDDGIELKDVLSIISLENITFSYKDSEDKALDNINLSFEASKKYAIVGESGSGKSTIAKLILNFYKCNDGRVVLNDEDILKISSKDLYKSISYIHQNTFLFDDTLRNNITLYNEYSDEAVSEAIELSGLSDFALKLHNGLDSNIGENGNTCSGGERQRIGIARAIICKSKFLILDESTSSLDTITANNILNNVLDLKDNSSIIITHQLNYNILSKCDVIYVMKKGSLVESGSLEELLKNRSYFYNLYNIS